jgi:hypothetical protein
LRAALAVLATVKFDNETRVLATKIDDVGPNWYLAAKLQTAKSAIAQPKPQGAFGISLSMP